jgi:RNA polymerase sigma-70 factor (ECF subfamily)
VALTWTRREPSLRPAGAPAPAGAGDDILERLLVQVARGDEQAFAELYRRVAAAVFGLVSKVVRNPAQSEEVTQEVFVELWRTAPRFDPARGTARSWIMTCATGGRSTGSGRPRARPGATTWPSGGA